MTQIRPLEAGDILRVAALYQSTFAGGDKRASPQLADCLRAFYLDGPGADGDIPSLVHLDRQGEISGFVGVNTVPMLFGDRPMRVAFAGALMVGEPRRDPLAGARLLKAFLSGPQDLSLSETANKTSLDMSKALRGAAFPAYSLEWMRAFTPTAFACDMVLRRSRLRTAVLPIARGIDGLVRHTGFGKSLAIHPSAAGKANLLTRPVDAVTFADAVESLTAHYALRSGWTKQQLHHVVTEAMDKPAYGQPVALVASRGDGAPVGAFLYHLRPGGVGRVFQFLALPGRESDVVDTLFADAAGRGASGLRGRTQPALLNGLLGKKAMFANASSTVVFSRDEAILDSFRTGRAFVNGIAGESWGRHIGGDFG
ncbi:hypothetical protein [Rhizobium sp.]